MNADPKHIPWAALQAAVTGPLWDRGSPRGVGGDELAPAQALPPGVRAHFRATGGAAWQVTAWGFCYHQMQLGCCKPPGVDTGPVPLTSSGPYWGSLQPQIQRWQPLLSAPQLMTFERESGLCSWVR